MEQVLLSLQVMKMQRDIKGLHNVSNEFWPFLEGGLETLYASFSQSFLLQFWKSQCPFGSKYPEFSNTPPTFAFWMSLRVVMAIFRRNDIFFETPCIYIKETIRVCVCVRPVRKFIRHTSIQNNVGAKPPCCLQSLGWYRAIARFQPSR